jgi:hypothetical protein
MSNPQNQTTGMDNLPALPATGPGEESPRPEKSPRYIFKRDSAEPLRPSRKTPATPQMMNPTAAWRVLCAKTGGGISLGTFYRWIRDGRIYTIRMGKKKIMVPNHMLDLVIHKILSGDDWQ